ncbi:hypothetical protein ABZ719_35945 [Streptomyces sp. NPDC006743]|uniref:hypothetical protein n=1 Tax=Streptomyces sp. NPDC006743 TaxID=3154480 RepID=UPI00345546F5
MPAHSCGEETGDCGACRQDEGGGPVDVRRAALMGEPAEQQCLWTGAVSGEEDGGDAGRRRGQGEDRGEGSDGVSEDNKPGGDGAVHVVMELTEPPALWWDLARQRAQVAVVWFAHLHRPTGPEMETALNARAGRRSSARRVPPVDLL